MMEYMFVIAGEEYPAPAPGEPGFDEYLQPWLDYAKRLMDGGHWISGASLAPSSTATTVRKAFGAEPAVVDGPFMETKEQLGGYYVVRAADLDEALELAAAIPIPAGTVEVRPLGYRPDAEPGGAG
ncbi:YciI family protein [Jiangella alkaliphila]|uniref:Uncharacterized conserved protein n=1 Tax=Jiangella alkaliphila TaxID=419479 RepID=A0A1H2JGW4_9ACTN|nr:YciI family protein [Jiangella alkaliphila]SDU55659.1 Uncharacterized conserved protein [Jiangella alkaliphila]